MNCIIYWFSGTGNSLAIARELNDKYDGECVLIPIATAINNPEIKTAERVVFIYPVYAFGIPSIVAEFIKKFPVNPDSSFYSITTPAGIAGGPHSEVNNLLNQQNGKLLGGWTIIMPSNYTPFGGPCPIEKQHQQFNAMKEKIQEIAGKIFNREKAKYEDSFFPLSFLSRFIHKMSIRSFVKEGKKFWTTDSCTNCGLCAKICPVNNIEIKDGKPVWLDKCEQCFACLQWCPVEAIQYKKSTEGIKRYHHPEVNPEDLCF